MHFSAAKSGRKAVQGTTRPLTIPRREDFVLRLSLIFHASLTRVTGFYYGATVKPLTKSLADAPHCSIWGSLQSQTFSGQSVIIYLFQAGQKGVSCCLFNYIKKHPCLRKGKTLYRTQYRAVRSICERR